MFPAAEGRGLGTSEVREWPTPGPWKRHRIVTGAALAWRVGLEEDKRSPSPEIEITSLSSLSS